MEFIIGLGLGISIGFIWGIWRATQTFIERIMERPEEIRELLAQVERAHVEVRAEMAEEARARVTEEVRAEFHNDHCYLYDHNDQFLAQGPTVNDAIQAAERRFPDMKFSFRLNEAKESAQ